MGGLRWKFSNWNSNFGFKCLSGGSVWICHWNANRFPCSAVHWGMKININFDFQHIKTSTFSANMWGFGNAFIQHAVIHYSCLYAGASWLLCSELGLVSAWSLLTAYSLTPWNVAASDVMSVCTVQTLWLSLPGSPAVCTQRGHCHFESESHRTSWWPSGSNFLPHLSPQVL